MRVLIKLMGFMAVFALLSGCFGKKEDTSSEAPMDDMGEEQAMESGMDDGMESDASDDDMDM